MTTPPTADRIAAYAQFLPPRPESASTRKDPAESRPSDPEAPIPPPAAAGRVNASGQRVGVLIDIAV